jgi:hypothetical protein
VISAEIDAEPSPVHCNAPPSLSGYFASGP